MGLCRQQHRGGGVPRGRNGTVFQFVETQEGKASTVANSVGNAFNT